MKALFGTDGIRGEAGRFPLDASTVNIIGFSLARYLRDSLKAAPKIIIGRDTRESGEWIEQALIAGANNAGAECHSAGVITTPGVAFLTRRLAADAGVVISASHNPYQDNGIKIFSPSGRKLEDSVERLIEADIVARIETTKSKAADRTFAPLGDEASLLDRYLNFLIEEIGKDFCLKSLKIVVDCANGACSKLAPALFERLGATVVPINCEPDGRNINLNCGSLHIDGLRERVKREQADLGVAFDGDADRSLFVDENGTYVDGDATLWVLANHLRRTGQLNRDTVVSTVMSNIGLEIAFRSTGVKLVRTDVGDKYVLEELLRSETSLGGEQSGHIIMPELSLAGDGMITALCLLRALRESDQTLSQATSGFRTYPQILVNVRVREKTSFSDLRSVRVAVDQVEHKLANRGRLLLRYSGTEPLARVMIEGEDQKQIESYANQIAEAIRQEIGV
ncbi:MAG: phosphoglucosamine mutase [Blastocatellia bacterium]|nr:MAG: phosphoglucosamine mutase [Blastocatellia bacterium]